KRVIGVDVDPGAVEHATREYAAPNLEFRAGSVTAIPVPEQQVFDLIVSFETIEHVGKEQQFEFCREVRRLLKPDGVFLVSTPDRAAYSDKPQYHNDFHYQEFYRNQFVEFLLQFFPSVRLHGQKVYCGSRVWHLDEPGRPLIEYQLGHSEGRFHP